MNRRLFIISLVAMLFISTVSLVSAQSAQTAQSDVSAEDATSVVAIFVSPSGNDDNPGTIEAPLATMVGARDKIRELKEAGSLLSGGVTVYFRGGLYPIKETVYFSEDDSGTVTAPIRYEAYPGETPVFSGGSYISGSDFLPIEDSYMLSRLNPEERSKVLCYDLFANGFSYSDLDYAKDFWQAGKLREYDVPHYIEYGYFAPRMQVFIDDDALYPARFPNKTRGTFVENPYNRYVILTESDVVESGFDWNTGQQTGQPCVFKTHLDRIKNWKSYEDIIIAGMMGVGYDYDEIIAASIDPETMTVTLKATPSSGLMALGRYLFANVFEELDTPGEYYIDKNSGMLYIYPTKNMDSATVQVSCFGKPYAFFLKDASHITFSGLTFELSKSSIMRITGGEHVALEGNTFKNIGMHGVHIGEGVMSTWDIQALYGTPEFQEYIDAIPASLNGLHHGIRGNLFLNMGYRAATVFTGNIAYREKGGFVFENNVVKHTGLIGSTYTSGIALNGCGITIKNNSFLFSQGQAICGSIVDTEIIYNDFCDSPCDMAEDTGALYLNYITLNDGVKVRYNYFHDIPLIQSSGFGYPLREGGAYFDNNAPFKDFCYNVVYNVPSASIYIDHYVPSSSVGNIIVDAYHSASAIPVEWIEHIYKGETGREIVERDDYTLGPHFNSGFYKDELWRQNYPELYEYYEYMLQKTDCYPLMSDLRDNVIVHLGRTYSHRAGILPPSMPIDPKYGRYENNHYFTTDPGFVNLEGYNFQLTQEAAQRLGVEWIDMSKIGVPGLKKPVRVTAAYEDPMRWVLPDTDPMIQLRYGTEDDYQYGERTRMVNFWRQVSPGVWEWEADDGLFPYGAAGIPMKSGAMYTAYYPGCENFPPQFLGGLDGETPPEGVLTFTVEADRDRWDLYVFELVKRSASASTHIVSFHVDGEILAVAVNSGESVSANGKGYTVYLSQSGESGLFMPFGNVSYNAKGATIRGLVNGVTYHVYIEYNDGRGVIAASEIIRITPG